MATPSAIHAKQLRTLLQNVEAEALRSSRPISSQMQIFPGQSTCVKPTLTRPQSSKAECLILRHRRHAAIRCTAELTVRLLLHLHSRPIASLAAFLRPIVRQSSALGHANTSLPSSRRRRRRHGCMDASLSSAMDIPSWSLPCLL